MSRAIPPIYEKEVNSMALLDLQNMELPEPPSAGGGSRGSKGCGGSRLSLLLCR